MTTRKTPKISVTRVERGQQRGADRDEDAAGDERAQDPPEEHAVLEILGDGEEGERRQKDEQVVDGERFFDQPGLEELQPAIGSGPKVDAEVEEQRHADPERPTRSPPRGRARRAPCGERPQIERQHSGHDHAEDRPRQRLARRGHVISVASRAALRQGGLRCGEIRSRESFGFVGPAGATCWKILSRDRPPLRLMAMTATMAMISSSARRRFRRGRSCQKLLSGGGGGGGS